MADTTDEDLIASLFVEPEEEATEEQPDGIEEDSAADADEEAADEETDGDDEETEEQPEKPRTFKVKVDGEELEVPEDELLRGYSGQAYIQKGMREVAAERQSLQAERERFIAHVQQVQQVGVIPNPGAPPPVELLRNDPFAYWERKAQYDQHLEAYQTQQRQIAHEEQARQQNAARLHQQFLSEQRKILEKAIPEYADPVKREAWQSKIVKTGLAYGFSDQEMGAIADARYAQVLNDAMRYRELQASKAKAKAPAPLAHMKAGSNPQAASAPSAKKYEQIRQKARGGNDAAIAAMLLTPPPKRRKR